MWLSGERIMDADWRLKEREGLIGDLPIQMWRCGPLFTREIISLMLTTESFALVFLRVLRNGKYNRMMSDDESWRNRVSDRWDLECSKIDM